MDKTFVYEPIDLCACYEPFEEPPADLIEEWSRLYWEGPEDTPESRAFYLIEPDGTMYYYSVKSKIMEEIDSLDPDDRHYIRRKADLDDRLYRMYDKIEETESRLIEARAKKTAIEAEKITGDNIYKVLIYFDKLYKVMNDVEKRQLMESLISEIQIFEDRQPNGQWLKSMKFKLPIIEGNMELSLDNDEHVEAAIRLCHEPQAEKAR